MSFNITLRPLLAVAAAFSLAACSSGPSSGDVKSAIQDELDRLNEQVEMVAGSRMAAELGKYELTDFELVGCEPAGEAFQCDIVYSMQTPMMPFNDKAVSVRMRESDRGWVVMGGAQGILMGGLN